MKYAFHPDARLEYREAAAFYESRRPGLAARFTIEIEAALERLLQNPQRCGFIAEDVRRCAARVFPYSILYTVEDDSILIIAIAHKSRKPGYWKTRLRPDV